MYVTHIQLNDKILQTLAEVFTPSHCPAGRASILHSMENEASNDLHRLAKMLL